MTSSLPSSILVDKPTSFSHSVAKGVFVVGVMMNPVSPQQFLDDQFPVGFRHLIPTTLSTAYRHAARLAAEEPILQVPSAQDNRGRLISWAVDFGFSRLIDSGALPFEYSWEYFAKPTGRYLAMRPSHSIITISQITDPISQPRNVLFRENARISNAPFFNLPEFEDEGEVTGEPHILITHGHQELQFAHLCVPDPNHSNGYRCRSSNLLNLPHETTSDGPPAEDTDTDFDSLGLLKEDIERWRKDHERS